MAAAYVDSVSTGTSGSSLSVDLTSLALTHSAGDLLVLQVHGYDALGAPSGGSLSWTEFGTLALTNSSAPGATAGQRVFWAVSAGGSPTSFTVSNGIADQIDAAVMSISGADTTTPLDAALASQGTTSTTFNLALAAISPTGSDSLLIAGVGGYSSGALTGWTVDGVMTEATDTDRGGFNRIVMAHQALIASGTTGTRTFTDAPDSDLAYIGYMLAIKSGSGGGSAPTLGYISTHMRPNAFAPGLAR